MDEKPPVEPSDNEQNSVQVIDISALQTGLMIVGFVGVPELFAVLQDKSIAFLQKYDFHGVVVLRDGEQKEQAAADLRVGDRVCSLGVMHSHIPITREDQCGVLKRMGFSQIKVRALSPQESGEFASLPQDQSTPFQADADESAPRHTASTGQKSNPARQAQLREGLHKMQDVIEQSTKTIERGGEILTDLFAQGHVKLSGAEALYGITGDICDAIERDRAASSVITVLKDHDEYTFRHCVDVANQTLSTLYFMNRHTAEELREIVFAALLHDIGKSKIPRSIINKVGRLDKDEWRQMRMHPIYSAQIMTDMGLKKLQIDIGHYHHVLKNGKGYPNFPFAELKTPVRVVTICDVYQALITKRPYKTTDTPFVALKKIKILAQNEFDSYLVDVFVKAAGLYPPGSLVELSDGTIGFVIANSEDAGQPVVMLAFNEKREKLSNSSLVDLSSPEFEGLSVSEVLDHRIFFEDNNALDYFINMDI